MTEGVATQGLKKSQLTRRRILDAAARLFREHGFADARLTDIAAEAGTQAGSLYYHFESRDDLLDQVLSEGVDRIFDAVVERVEALGADADPMDKLSCAIRTHLETMLELDDYSSAHMRIVNQVPRAIRAGHLKRQRAYVKFWHGLLSEAQATGRLRPDLDLSVNRMLLLGMLNWSIEWFRPDGLSATAIAAQATALVLRGISAPPGQTQRGRSEDCT